MIIAYILRFILVYTFSVSKQCGSLPEHHNNSGSTCAPEALHPCRIFDMLSGAGFSFVLWLLCAFEMNFIILLAQSLTQSSLCRLVLEASTRDYVVSSYIMTILAQQWLMYRYLVICGGDQTPNTVFENSLKIYWMRYSEWVLRNNNLEIQKCCSQQYIWCEKSFKFKFLRKSSAKDIQIMYY